MSTVMGTSKMVLMFSVLTVVVLIIRDQKVKSITHGSAHFATRQEIEDFGYDKCGRPLWLKLCRFWEIKKNSRNFAKRQYTWFKNQMDVHWYDIMDKAFKESVFKDVEYFLKGDSHENQTYEHVHD